MPPSVQSWQSEYWRWQSRDCFQKDATSRQNSPVSLSNPRLTPLIKARPPSGCRLSFRTWGKPPRAPSRRQSRRLCVVDTGEGPEREGFSNRGANVHRGHWIEGDFENDFGSGKQPIGRHCADRTRFLHRLPIRRIGWAISLVKRG